MLIQNNRTKFIILLTVIFFCNFTNTYTVKNPAGLRIIIPESHLTDTNLDVDQPIIIATQAKNILRQQPKGPQLWGYYTLFNLILAHYYDLHPTEKPNYNKPQAFKKFVNLCTKKYKTPRNSLTEKDLWQIITAVNNHGSATAITGITPSPVAPLTNVLILNIEYLKPPIKSAELVEVLKATYASDGRKELLTSTTTALQAGKTIYIIIDPDKDSIDATDNPKLKKNWFLITLKKLDTTYHATIFASSLKTGNKAGIVSPQSTKLLNDLIALFSVLAQTIAYDEA